MRPLGLRLPVAFAVRAVLHGDEAELDQRAVEPFHLGLRQAERFLLHRAPKAIRSAVRPAPSPAAG